ncbi:putative glycoside hydrolase family 15 protein [Actinophytocola sp. NPDC049390]|uniref:putative glycoside hydrolase family 15 protein n=1 Tax=Actinophytocola sp. NPDC049390 TaxID=3363894 RepID=UPI0037B75847
MPTKPLNRRSRGFRLGIAALVLVASCAPGWATNPNAPPPKPLAPCAWWYGIGEPPTTAELELAAKRYDVVVLNATETAAMRKLHELNPKIKVLVYKDLSSTRNYPGAVDGDIDATWLPSGIGYFAAQNGHPDWFALDTAGKRIEWRGYPKHWQMTVWDNAYQKAWTAAVTAEVTREGWDGVLADNDFNSLSHYSAAVLAGTANAHETDRRLRDGLDAFLTMAGDSLAKAGKMFVPNVSETRLIPGRWTAHSRFSGAMEENFGFRDDGGTGELLTFQGNEWKELRAQAALGESWLLLLTRTRGAREERAGYASAAMLAGPYTCWTQATTSTYLDPEWSKLQDSGLGQAVETANRHPSGVWTRRFTGGWVAVNPTAAAVTVTPPAGLVDPDGNPVSTLDLAAADGAVLVKPAG